MLFVCPSSVIKLHFVMCDKVLRGHLKKKVNFKINAILKHKTEVKNYKRSHKMINETNQR
jgi:hypothetical protein